MGEIKKSIEELEKLVTDILVAHKTSESNAQCVAKALVAAEIEGQKGHGLSRVPSYAAQARTGKVDGFANPKIHPASEAALRIDVQHGFAFPAFSAATDALVEVAERSGIAAASLANSHHCGMLGYHAENLARKGLIAIIFSNSPKAIAPWGGKDAVFGTNPIAFASPRKDKDPLVIDLSLSKVARGKVKVAYEAGEPIPEGWALDKDGNQTTNAEAAMNGTMVPMGEGKGAALVLMVEILSAALSASHFGFEASSFFTPTGPSPDIGQLIIAIAPNPLSNNSFFERLETLIQEILQQDGTRLPGSGKAVKRGDAIKNGLTLDSKKYDDLVALLDN